MGKGYGEKIYNAIDNNKYDAMKAGALFGTGYAAKYLDVPDKIQQQYRDWRYGNPAGGISKSETGTQRRKKKSSKKKSKKKKSKRRR